MFNRYFKKNISTLVALLSILIGLVLTFNYANAETLNAGVLKISYSGSGPLFSAQNIAPGYSETKVVTVKNTGTLPHSFSVAVSGTLGSLADALKIKTEVLGIDVWEKTLSDISLDPDSNLIVGSIAPGGEALISFTASLPRDVGNSFQGAETFAFSFVMGNESTDSPEPNDDEFESLVGGNIASLLGVSSIGKEDAEQPKEPADPDTIKINEEVPQPEAKGEEKSDLVNCFWWWLLLIIFALFLTIYFVVTNKREMVFRWVWPIFGSVVLILVHWGLHDFYEKVVYCDWFWFFELILLVVYFVLSWAFSEEEPESSSKQ